MCPGAAVVVTGSVIVDIEDVAQVQAGDADIVAGLVLVGSQVDVSRAEACCVNFPGSTSQVFSSAVGCVVARINGGGALLEAQVAVGWVGEEWGHIAIAAGTVSAGGVAALYNRVGDGGSSTTLICYFITVIPKNTVGHRRLAEVVVHSTAYCASRITGEGAVGHHRGG